MTELHGIVLAAGASRRMGTPKPLLSAGGQSLIERAVRALLDGGCAAVTAVVRADDAATAELAGAAGAEVVQNPEHGSEQVDSLRIALAAVPSEAAAALVLPVDHPRMSADAVRTVVDAFRARGAPIVRPTHAGVPGHPTLFHRSIFPELSAPDLREGARTVIQRHRERVEDVAVAEPGVVQDVNTPEEYRRVAP